MNFPESDLQEEYYRIFEHMILDYAKQSKISKDNIQVRIAQEQKSIRVIMLSGKNKIPQTLWEIIHHDKPLPPLEWAILDARKTLNELFNP